MVQGRTQGNRPECLSELERLVHDAFALFVVSKFRIALLNGQKRTPNKKISLTVKGKSFLKGCPSKPDHIVRGI